MSKRPLYYADYGNYVKKRSNTILKSCGEILEADSRLDVKIECDIDNISRTTRVSLSPSRLGTCLYARTRATDSSATNKGPTAYNSRSGTHGRTFGPYRPASHVSQTRSSCIMAAAQAPIVINLAGEDIEMIDLTGEREVVDLTGESPQR
ncbi:unnamed protein product [Trichogramma brassicae]|uniref:Uncharacterized protein n=1 Tax=Trichogramma brassicae TaxID=86971 RepID=A0A6H5IQD5_9HYME|nr:unnamed protein product [Trichogramma brassicae]